jgi:hypothetical protein
MKELIYRDLDGCSALLRLEEGPFKIAMTFSAPVI